MSNMFDSPNSKLADALSLNGHAIDIERCNIRDCVSEISEHLNELINMGCIRAHIHFKVDGKTMFMNQPSNEMGLRKYIHVGVNPEKQKAARDKVFRESKRSDIQRRLDSLTSTVRDLDRQLANISRSYSRALNDIKELLAACEGPNEAPVAI